MSETHRSEPLVSAQKSSPATTLLRRFRDSPALQYELRFYLLLLIAFAVSIAYRSSVNHWAASGRSLLPIAIAAAFAIAFLRITMAEFSRPTAIVLRTVFGLFGVYLIFGFPAILASDLPALQAFAIGPGRYLAALVAFGACIRPSLGLIPLAYLLWYKGFHAAYSGLSISGTDYLPLVDVATFLVVGGFCALLAKRTAYFGMLFSGAQAGDGTALSVMERVFLFGVAIHMANYFYSGWKKVQLGEHALSWVLHNRTEVLILVQHDMGQLPLSFNTALIGMSYEAFGQMVVLANVITLVGQLLALVAMARVRWMLWAVLFYDLTHVLIFLTTGIFFYKWIVLNTSLAFALVILKHRKVSLGLFAALVAAALIAPKYFFVAQLGWWDTPVLNHERLEAVTADNRSIPIPSNYWGAYSITAAQQRLMSPRGSAIAPTRTSGNTLNETVMRQALKCEFDASQFRNREELVKFWSTENHVTRLVRNYHRWVLDRSARWGGWYFNVYPHHIFSMPWEFAAFKRLDPKEIVTYRYVAEAVCLGYDNGKLTRRVLQSFQHDIPVAK